MNTSLSSSDPASVSKGSILIVGDLELASLLGDGLQRAGYVLTATAAHADALQLADEALLAIIHQPAGGSPGASSLEEGVMLTEQMRERCPDLPVILVTDDETVEAAIAALRAGVHDIVTTPFEPAELIDRVNRAAQFAALTRHIRPRHHLEPSTRQTRFVGSSDVIRRVQDMITRVAESDASVVIHGDTGTGKELVARAIHEESTRAHGPFVAINCAAMPENLLESELFGHSRGAFTDAKVNHAGLFVQATGGVLLLDEIGEMPMDMQSKLLRALQERVVRPIGSNAEVPFDVRILCATHRDLEAMVAAGRFRRDLYYRLNVVTIEIPPLSARGTDAIELATAILARASARDGRAPITLSHQVAERLLSYDWPGNVRELENCMERAMALARSDVVSVDDLPERVRLHRGSGQTTVQEQATDVLTLDQLERNYIDRVIKMVRGNKSRAAQLLGLDRRTLYRRLERYAAESAAAGQGQPNVAV